MVKRKINIHNQHHVIALKKLPLKRFARQILHGEGISQFEVNIIFVDHSYIIELNKTYLHRDSTTDVISFPLSDGDEKLLEGEVYINIDQIMTQALEYQELFLTELLRIVAHGVLHVVGYPDKTKTEKALMTAKEDFYLQQFAKEVS